MRIPTEPMKLGDLSGLSREELVSLCEELHYAMDAGYDAWAKSEHALHVLVEQRKVTRKEVEKAREIGTSNFNGGYGLFCYEVMYDGPARPLTPEEAKSVRLMGVRRDL